MGGKGISEEGDKRLVSGSIYHSYKEVTSQMAVSSYEGRRTEGSRSDFCAFYL